MKKLFFSLAVGGLLMSVSAQASQLTEEAVDLPMLGYRVCGVDVDPADLKSACRFSVGGGRMSLAQYEQKVWQSMIKENPHLALKYTLDHLMHDGHRIDGQCF